MESSYLRQLVNNAPLSSSGSADTNAPYSFIEWKARRPLLVEKDAVYYYNTYVVDWFAANKEKHVSQKFVLRQKYLYLLDQLQLFFSEEEKNTWYNQVNLADEKELLLAIPYFAKKLKDIALYYLKLRKQLKNTKLKYSSTGTGSEIEREIYRYFLETFSSINNELSPDLQTTVPSFSSLQQSLIVEVEELYDGKQYFDLSPTKPLSEYFDLLHTATASFLSTKGIVLSSSESLFNSFNIPLTSDFTSFISQLTGTIFEQSDASLYSSYIQKYIAENKYIVTFSPPVSTTTITNVDIAAGNNYFYYPGGTVDTRFSIPGQLPIVALSTINVGNATAGTSLKDSDVILVQTGKEQKSAWLYYREFDETPKTIKAVLQKDSKTSFIYPFPGYGLSGQNFPWTGNAFETTAEYDFLSKELKSQVNNAYWNQTLPSDRCNSILLNNTTLVKGGAAAGASPQHADRFFIRLPKSTDITTPYGELSGAWLYKFTATSIPIAPNRDNVFLWPYGIVTTGLDYPPYLREISYTGACTPVSIQDLSKTNFIAASSFDLADKVYKLNNPADLTTKALECAWLSGATVDSNNYHYVAQEGFAALMAAGETVRFVWTGPETSLDEVFGYVSHKADCPFVTGFPSVSAFEWQKCSCKQVYHSPFGHPYENFQDGNNFADCIARVTEPNLNPFDFSSWNSSGYSVYNSLDFAWYKTNSYHGWGDGLWTTNYTSPSADAPPLLSAFHVEADHLIITYYFTQLDGKDLDTRTQIISPFTSTVVGWNRSTYTYPETLHWGGDNTGYGVESVHSDLTHFGPEDLIKIKCSAFWFSVRSAGNMAVRVDVYKGGTVRSQFGHNAGYGFDVTGAELKARIEFAFNVKTTTPKDVEGEYVATIVYDKKTGILGWSRGDTFSTSTSSTATSSVSSSFIAPLSLQPGHAYFYKRANTKSSTENMPSYAVNYAFDKSKLNNTKWITAKLNSDLAWYSNDTPSAMSFYPGEFIKYERQADTTSYLISSYQVEIKSSNTNSVWSTYDTIPVVCGESNSTIISWPAQAAPFGSTSKQYPSVSLSEIDSIVGWTITRDQDGESHTILNESVVTFVPPTTGTYSVSVTAVVSTGQTTTSQVSSSLAVGMPTTVGTSSSLTVNISAINLTVNSTNSVKKTIVVSSIIPKISAIDAYAMEQLYIDFTTPSSGFLMEHPLSGWNYNTNTPSISSKGARPYWAVLDSQKDSTTRYKGIESWGYSNTYIDEYLPDSAPVISPIELKYGTILEYFRRGYKTVWNQPITYKQFVGTTQWCQISADVTQFSNLSSLYDIKKNIDPIIIATKIPTDILLSNVLNGASVEVYYHALNSFVWPVDVTKIETVALPSPTTYFQNATPWNTLSNRFFPTIANVPVLEEVYTAKDVGGYFLPQNLGSSVFLNKDFTITFKSADLSGTYITENPNIHIGGRGRTHQDQDTVYDWTENNQWLKEASTAGDLAGSVKKTLTKTLQTFVPYQSNISETALGLVTGRSKLSPWGGLNDEEWADPINDPKSFTGIRNIPAWTASQVLKENEKMVDCWASDIYGNQYGLFKNAKNASVVERHALPGELWVRTNNQEVNSAEIALSSLFEPFKAVSSSIYSDLTGSGIIQFNCYFDTLFIETSGAAIFAKISYNYDTSTIQSIFDDVRYTRITDTNRFENVWFFSAEKKIIALFTNIYNSGNMFYPELFEYDLVSETYKRIYPISSEDRVEIMQALQVIQFKRLSKGSIHFNKTQNTFLITYTGIDTNDKMFVVNLCVKNKEHLKLTQIDIYRDLFDPSVITEPPIVLDSYLNVIGIPQLSSFSVSVSATNNPTSFTLLNYTDDISTLISNGAGVFAGKLPAGLHHINYNVSNTIGSSTYCLTLSAS